MSHPYEEVSEKRDYSKRQAGENQDLPVKSEYPSQDYAFMNPFFATRENGFLFFC